MKILHINDYYINSWAEQIYRNIYDNLWWKKIELNNYLFKNNILKIVNKFFFSFSLYLEIRKVIKNYNPEVILLHNINLSPFSVLYAIRWHKNIVQIVHDATQAGCPSGWCIYRKNYWKCDIKMNYKKCSQNCAFDKPKIWFTIYYFWLKYFLFLKKKIIKKYISPSQSLTYILKNNEFKNTITLLNTIDINWNDNISQKENIFLYIWAVDKRKWIDLLLEAIDELDFIKKDWKIMVIWDWEILEELKNKYKDNFYHFLGRLTNQQALEYCKKSKILFVPSILFESFWLVALEGILNNNIVLGNNIWWIPEIITESNTFNILDKNTVKNKLVDVLNNFEKYYNKSQRQKQIFIDNNKKYFSELKKIISK